MRRDSAESWGAMRKMIPERLHFCVSDIAGGMVGGTFDAAASAQREKSKPFDEGTDTYDTIEWLVKNVRATTGAWAAGISYGGC